MIVGPAETSPVETAGRQVLITGATGLLGSYLVRDLLLAGENPVVLVRPDRKRNPAARIEAMVTGWEAALGESLPRPTVIAGDLTAPCCGRDADTVRRLGDRCGAILHNAASLTVHGADREGEPWRTNVGGTSHVLDLARAAGIGEFHHVSTAYVCGLRSGRILESELDVGQRFGNDYESSKVEAEALVRRAGHLRSLTVHRPSIIVGDSRNGYTSTYHGLFAVVRLGHTMLPRMIIGSTSSKSLLRILGINARDRKNFVPVDWVSAVIAHVLRTPSAHGRTYHLTHPQPVPTELIARVTQEAVERFSPSAAPDDPDVRDERWFADTMRSQLGVYRSYLRCDPEFDRAATKAHADHIPCPRLDHESLLRMARFAIECDFGRRPETWRRPDCWHRPQVSCTAGAG
jgi:thioester reductase-like protein